MAIGEVNAELLKEITRRTEKVVANWSEGTTVENLRPMTGGASSLTFVIDLRGGRLTARGLC